MTAPGLRVVFMGTPEFAATILSRLCDSQHSVVGVVTRQDSPSGRGRRVVSSAVSQLADDLGIPQSKPSGRRDPVLLGSLQEWNPDVAVVAAFGIILPQEVLDLPRRGCINVHASLLPRYRGAAPVQDAIIKGESQTGVTTMQMDAGLDTGGILLQRKIDIAPSETAGELEGRLADLGAGLLLDTLDGVGTGQLEPTPQDDAESSYSRSLSTADGYILWDQPASDTHNRIRGCTPRPGARCFLAGQQIRIWRSEVATTQAAGAERGQVVAAERKGLVVACSSGCIRLLEVQPAGRQRMGAADYARGLGASAGKIRLDTDAPQAS